MNEHDLIIRCSTTSFHHSTTACRFYYCIAIFYRAPHSQHPACFLRITFASAAHKQSQRICIKGLRPRALISHGTRWFSHPLDSACQGVNFVSPFLFFFLLLVAFLGSVLHGVFFSSCIWSFGYQCAIGARLLVWR